MSYVFIAAYCYEIVLGFLNRSNESKRCSDIYSHAVQLVNLASEEWRSLSFGPGVMTSYAYCSTGQAMDHDRAQDYKTNYRPDG